VKLYRAH